MGAHVRAGGCAAAASGPLRLGDAGDGYVVPRHPDLALAGTKGRSGDSCPETPGGRVHLAPTMTLGSLAWRRSLWLRARPGRVFVGIRVLCRNLRTATLLWPARVLASVRDRARILGLGQFPFGRSSWASTVGYGFSSPARSASRRLTDVGAMRRWAPANRTLVPSRRRSVDEGCEGIGRGDVYLVAAGEVEHHDLGGPRGPRDGVEHPHVLIPGPRPGNPDGHRPSRLRGQLDQPAARRRVRAPTG